MKRKTALFCAVFLTPSVLRDVWGERRAQELRVPAVRRCLGVFLDLCDKGTPLFGDTEPLCERSILSGDFFDHSQKDEPDESVVYLLQPVMLAELTSNGAADLFNPHVAIFAVIPSGFLKHDKNACFDFFNQFNAGAVQNEPPLALWVRTKGPGRLYPEEQKESTRCRRWDLNPHPLRDTILSRARLPLRHSGNGKSVLEPSSERKLFPEFSTVLALRACARMLA